MSINEKKNSIISENSINKKNNDKLGNNSINLTKDNFLSSVFTKDTVITQSLNSSNNENEGNINFFYNNNFKQSDNVNNINLFNIEQGNNNNFNGKFNQIKEENIEYFSGKQNKSLNRNDISIDSYNNRINNNNINIKKRFTDRAALLNIFSDKNNTMHLQSILKNMSKEEINEIIEKLNGCFRRVIMNHNGNYFLKDLIKYCNQDQRIIILKDISKTLSMDSLDDCANHPIQTIIEFCDSEIEYDLILKSFDSHNIYSASLNQNGSRVIQKIIKKIPEQYLKNFYSDFIKRIHMICRQKYGHINAKTFVDEIKDDKLKEEIVNEICSYFMDICKDHLGNFFIQHILEKWNNSNAGHKLKKLIIENFQELFGDHYANYICKLFLKIATIDEKKYLIKSLHLVPNNQQHYLIQMEILASFDKNESQNNNVQRQNLNYTNTYNHNNNYKNLSRK